MKKQKKNNKSTRILDDTVKLPKKTGNGSLKLQMTVDEKGMLTRYSLAYINHHICQADNGRVLGYDNSHGYHHRHFMGKEEAVDFTTYEDIAERFDKEWRDLHEKAKKHHR